MFTLLGFSLGFLALGAVAAVVDVLITVFTIAFTFYASLWLIGVIVFSVMGIRRLTARRRGTQGPAQAPDPSAPAVASHQVGR